MVFYIQSLQALSIYWSGITWVGVTRGGVPQEEATQGVGYPCCYPHNSRRKCPMEEMFALLTVSEGSACPGWKPKLSGSVLHEGVGQACILDELEAEMGELEDFFQSESLIGPRTFLLETPASQHSISIWENCSNRSL